ncbi:MAG: glycogen/starch synthase [Spirochaetes bacterium]|jgi:starch synthase|nr:glycogen/starch synthase [Spirochaetota bacterium]
MENKSVKNDEICGLCRFALKDEHLVQARYVKKEVSRAFEEGRAFPFEIRKELVDDMRFDRFIPTYHERIIDIRNSIYENLGEEDGYSTTRLIKDTRLAERLYSAVFFVHRAIADGEYNSLPDRRFVILKELPGNPTLYHVSNETTVISHVGQGPYWAELPTLYLGLKTFDILDTEYKRGETALFEAFKKLLKIEERAIETGFSHVEVYPAEYSIALNNLVNSLIEYTGQTELRTHDTAEKRETKPFSSKTRDKYLEMLNARYFHEPSHFDYAQNLKAVDGIARLARRYRINGDRESLHQCVRLLVSASGHDIHEIRNRANIILERLFAPKEYDAPLATVFYNLQAGDTFNFSLKLPASSKGYILRIYNYSCDEEFFADDDIDYKDYPMHTDEDGELYKVAVPLNRYGHYDFLVFKKKSHKLEWIDQYGASGRINVMPDVRGEIILEIFTDIHGHTKLYWHDETGNPGLVYNENGEVIRTGTFADITMHLADMKRRYSISTIYVLGCQKRGSHSEDWADGATSPSPFSPESLTEIEESLGGAEQFAELVRQAHLNDIKIIVDIIPHLNRHSSELSEENVVYCYGDDGGVYPRSATDGRYGSWDDGKLLNYRRFEVWEWVYRSIETLVENFGIDGIRFDSAHAVPIMMKRNNYPFVYDHNRSHEEMVEGRIILNDRWDDHFITTGFYDCQCRDSIAVPFHQFLMYGIQRILRKYKKDFFLYIAECFWGHERFLARSGIVPYNASFFKVCENISHGKSDVREIYHIYDSYYPSVLPQGTELLGIFGNHDERRALNTFGQHGLRAAIALTSFLSNIIMDYEGSAEGEGWKVYLDNIYVNWNQFEFASHRSVERFYRDIYRFHRDNRGRGHLLWANNDMVAAALKPSSSGFWVGAFNFADSNQTVSIQFDNPVLQIADDDFFRVVDPVYSKITSNYSYFSGKELKVSRVNTIVSYVDRVKLLKLEKSNVGTLDYPLYFNDSFYRLCSISSGDKFLSNFAFCELSDSVADSAQFVRFLQNNLIPHFWDESRYMLFLGLKRAVYYFYKHGVLTGDQVFSLIEQLQASKDSKIVEIGEVLHKQNSRGEIVFMSSETDPFSKSGGLANVVYELPREMAKMGEKVYVISGYYRKGDPKAVLKMTENAKKYKVAYTGKNVRFKIMGTEYEVGVHTADVNGVTYYLLDHYELFDGLYWGVTSEEKLRRRIGFARACAEVICTFGLQPYFTFTNDAFAALFSGIVRSDPNYSLHPSFAENTYLHIIHNGGWQYFDAYERFEKGFDLFSLFNLEGWKAGNFLDPVHGNRINCMAAGVRFSDRVITVSPSYARQIEYQSDGLEHILSNVLGISNGIGDDLYTRIKYRFDSSGFIERNYKGFRKAVRADKKLTALIQKRYPEILEGIKAVESIADEKRCYIVSRVMYKMLLQFERGLYIDPDKVLFCMIHRITEQKGYQLLLDTSEGIFKTLEMQGVMGGSVSAGDNSGDTIAHGLWLLSQYYPKSADVAIGFQDVSVPLMASDIFCMPSMNEPGGISQLEGFLCGCLLVARATGGLRDTVFPIRKNGDVIEGNGFLFSDYSGWAFYDAMERAVNFFRENDEDTIYKARMNACNSVFYWDIAARQYLENIYNMKEIVRVIDQ